MHNASVCARHVVPHQEGAGPQETVVRRPEQMTPCAKEIPREAVDRHEALRVPARFERSHLSLTLARRLMREFGAIVFVLRRAVHNRRPTAAPQRARIRRPERATPLPNGLVGDCDPALGQEILGIAEADTKAVVEPDGVTDDFRRE